jgi:regulator of replication initiation timing
LQITDLHSQLLSTKERLAKTTKELSTLRLTYKGLMIEINEDAVTTIPGHTDVSTSPRKSLGGCSECTELSARLEDLHHEIDELHAQLRNLKRNKEVCVRATWYLV